MCVAVPLRLIQMDETRTIGKVDVGGGNLITINLMLLDHPKIGDYVLTHAGMAIEVMDESAAKETLELFHEMGFFNPIINGG
ncbi:MAG: HypC/HybG/HupF family hydrogenase formation chaperone [Desulfobacterales bacterium]|nr:HypC/HybG/HupF family hydrogenase formation chaperone [Desulfobacterales bacterium]